MKEVLFEMLNNYDEEKFKKEVKDFCKVHHVTYFIATFLELFHDGRIEDCKKRLFIPLYLVKNEGLTAEVLLEAFQYRCGKMINLHADYPGLFKFYGFFIKTWCL